MNGSRSRRSLVLWSAVLMLLALVLAAPTARADHQADQPNHLAIASVGVDFGLHQLVINGVNLTRRNGTTSVALAEIFLEVVSADATQVVAALPVGIEPGDYRLVVWTGSGESHTDFWDLTIGAVGPKGEKGDKGDPGAPGLNGKDGAAGLNGKDGAAGLNGKDGAAGLDGKDGAAGLDGKDGAPGPQGPGGVRGFQEFLVPSPNRIQFFVVPDGVTRILVELWGGSGGGGGGGKGAGGGGGGGGYVRAVVTVDPGETLIFVIGPGGVGGEASTCCQNRANATGGGATSLLRRGDFGLLLVRLQADGGGFGGNSECLGCDIFGPIAAGGGPGGQFLKADDQRITSFLGRGGFGGGNGATAGLPGRGGRVPSGTVEPFSGKFAPAGGDGSPSIFENGQFGGPGFALISW